MKQRVKRIYQQKMWDAARIYCKEAEKCYKAKAYFSAIVARGCELEALLRIFDFIDTRKAKNRCYNFNCLINRAFARHWVPHDALRAWKKAERIPLKPYLHKIREARNGVHANLFDKKLVNRRSVANITYIVHAMYSFLETKNARNLMKHLHKNGQISDAEYAVWKKKQTSINL